MADELLKETNVRRSSVNQEAYLRATDNKNRSTGDRNYSVVPNVRKFRPFTMNLMTNVSILFADIAGIFDFENFIFISREYFL